MSGAEILKRVREIRPRLPGIIISGYADRESVAPREAGITVLAKPFSIDQMSQAILQACAAADGEEAARA